MMLIRYPPLHEPMRYQQYEASSTVTHYLLTVARKAQSVRPRRGHRDGNQ